MWYYLSLMIFIFFCFALEINSKSDRTKIKLFYICAFCVFFLLAFRSKMVGGDTENYCNFFIGKASGYGSLDKLDESIKDEIGFLLTARFFHLFGSSEFIFIFLSSALTLLPLLYIIRRDSTYRTLSLFVYMTLFGLLTTSQSAIRQNFSVSYLYIAYIIFTSPSIKKRKRVFFTILFCIMALLSHSTAYVALSLLIICYMCKLNKRRSIAIILGALALTFLSSTLFVDLFRGFYNLTSQLDFMWRMNSYYDSDNSLYELQKDRISILRLGPIALLCCLIIWMNDDEKMKLLPYKAFVVGSAIYILGFSFPLMFRATYPLLLIGTVATPTKINQPSMRLLKYIFLLMMLYFIQRQYSHFMNYDYIFNNSRQLPYSFIFNTL